jgi:hypothetical protein
VVVFARAVAADEAEHLARLHRERDLVERPDRPNRFDTPLISNTPRP